MHRVDDGEVDWFWLERGAYVAQQPDGAGRLHSRAFPGLWLDADALLAGDLTALRCAIDDGCRGAQHAALLQRLHDG